MSRWRKVEAGTWGDRRFSELSERAKLLAIVDLLRADIAEAVQLLRLVATHRDRDGELVCAECEAPVERRSCDADCSLAGFLARFPAPEVGS